MIPHETNGNHERLLFPSVVSVLNRVVRVQKPQDYSQKALTSTPANISSPAAR
jgi:hypothetical protein